MERTWELALVSLDLIDADEEVGVTPALHRSIDNCGMIDPCRLNLKENGRYTIEHGRHRVKDARERGWKEIIAIVEAVDDTTATMTGLVLSASHCPNIIVEARAIQHLLAEKNPDGSQRYTQQDIAHSCARTQGWVAQRLSLVERLIVELQEHVLNQTMTIGAARIAIHLSKEAQLELAKQKRVTQSDAAALLRTDLGDNLDLPDLPEIVMPDAGPARSITLTAAEWAQAEGGGVTITIGNKQIKVEVVNG